MSKRLNGNFIEKTRVLPSERDAKQMQIRCKITGNFIIKIFRILQKSLSKAG